VLLSLLNCVGALLFYGVAIFILHWRAYREKWSLEYQDQPLAARIILIGLGNAIIMLMFLVVWSCRPSECIKPTKVVCSCLTGILNGFGTFLYLKCCEEGLPAVIGGPVSGLHNLVPALWYWLYYRKCMGIKTALGFVFFIACLVLLSGLVSKSISSYTINSQEWMMVTVVTLAWGIALIFQAAAVENIKYQQFPQIQVVYNFGQTCCSIVYASVISISDVMDPSIWKPFGVNNFLMISFSVAGGLGVGLFFFSLYYTDDANTMLALLSLYITVPVILGIIALDEQASWNIILGLICALAGMIFLSMEVGEAVDRTDSGSRKTVDSIHTMINEYAENQVRSSKSRSILFEHLIAKRLVE